MERKVKILLKNRDEKLIIIFDQCIENNISYIFITEEEVIATIYKDSIQALLWTNYKKPTKENE